MIHAGGFIRIERTTERPFGGGFPQNGELVGGQFGAPFVIGLLNVVHTRKTKLQRPWFRFPANSAPKQRNVARNDDALLGRRSNPKPNTELNYRKYLHR